MDAPQPGDLYRSVVEPFWRVVSIYDGPSEFISQFRALPPKVGHLLAAHLCQSEIRNGGLYQFFSNSTGILAPEALAAFRAIGLDEWAEVLAEAMRAFGKTYPRDRADRLGRPAPRPGNRREDWDPFFTLDERFYSWLHAEPDRWARAADRFAEAPDAEQPATTASAR